jgi:hypothetical protein
MHDSTAQHMPFHDPNRAGPVHRMKQKDIYSIWNETSASAEPLLFFSLHSQDGDGDGDNDRCGPETSHIELSTPLALAACMPVARKIFLSDPINSANLKRRSTVQYSLSTIASRFSRSGTISVHCFMIAYWYLYHDL